jgi:cell division protein FtsQ
MNSQPLLSAQGSPRKPAKSSQGPGKNTLPNPYQQARRKRAASRQRRRFEAAFARIPLPQNLSGQLPDIALPAVLQPTPWYMSKALSFLLVLGALASFILLHSQEEWFVYREDVRYHNLIRMRGDDIFQMLDLDGWNIFWLDPEEIRANLVALPWIEEAKVRVSLPATVDIDVVEMTPAAVWVTNVGNYWLAANGAALPVATLEESALPELALPQIVDSLQEARVIGDGPLAIDPQVLTSALTLMEAMPELEGEVRYNHAIGLNFPLPDPAVWVYWGDGFDMQSKLENLAVTRDLVRHAEKPAQILDIRFVDRPYVR